MIKITMKQGDTVAIIEHGEIKKGIIKDVKVLDPPVAIVDFDGEIRKVLVEDLAKVQEESEEIQEDNEPVEKSEITITPDQFRYITISIIGEECAKMGSAGLMVGMSIGIIMSKIHNELFIDGAEND